MKFLSLFNLITRLRCYTVEAWAEDSESDEGFRDRTEADLFQADVVSSLTKGGTSITKHHQVVLDIDHPAWLLETSTPGHHHLFIEVGDGIPTADYFDMLRAMAKCGVLQPGYVGASEERGYTSARMPWVAKPEPDSKPGVEIHGTVTGRLSGPGAPAPFDNLLDDF